MAQLKASVTPGALQRAVAVGNGITWNPGRVVLALLLLVAPRVVLMEVTVGLSSLLSLTGLLEACDQNTGHWYGSYEGQPPPRDTRRERFGEEINAIRFHEGTSSSTT